MPGRADSSSTMRSDWVGRIILHSLHALHWLPWSFTACTEESATFATSRPHRQNPELQFQRLNKPQVGLSLRTTHASTMEPHPPKASLLGLPAEIRNSIYEYALLPPNAITVDTCTPVSRANCAVPALLRSNRQIRTEASDMFFSRATFLCSDLEHMFLWIAHLEFKYRKSMVKTLGGVSP